MPGFDSDILVFLSDAIGQYGDLELWNVISDNADPGAFNVLFERYWSSVLTTSFAYLREKEACHEITHD